MSTSDAADQVAPSYGLNQEPETAAQDELTTTPEPSRLSTVSRVLQAPETVCQCGNRSRLYVVVWVEPATVSAASSERAVAADGMPGGVAAAGAAAPRGSTTAMKAVANTAAQRR